MKLTARPLYLVTDQTKLDSATFLTRLAAACQGGVDLVQLREKTRSSRDFFILAQQVKAITDQYGLPLIIDDRLDIAQAVDAAGIHLGQSDLPIERARMILGSNKIIGATAKTVAQATQAERLGADYLGVGAIFPTTTHVQTVHTSVATLTAIRQAVSIPVYAIGGLNANNVATVMPARVAGVAVVSAIMYAPDTATTTRRLRRQVLKVVTPPVAHLADTSQNLS